MAAKWLALWWGAKTGEEARFLRVPASGGWQTSDVRGELNAVGDIMTTAKYFPFVVEVKYRENWKEEVLLAGKRSPMWKWWKQAIEESQEAKKIPLLMIRKNGTKWLCVLPAFFSAILREQKVPFYAPVLDSPKFLALDLPAFILIQQDDFAHLDPKPFISLEVLASTSDAVISASMVRRTAATCEIPKDD